MIRVIKQRVTIGPYWTAWLNAALTALSPTSLRGSELFAAITLVDAHVRAATQMFVGAPGAWSENFNYVLRRASQDPRFAALARVVAESASNSDENVESEIQDQFEFGLEHVLDGIETFLRSRCPAGMTTRPTASPAGRFGGGVNACVFLPIVDRTRTVLVVLLRSS